MKLSDINFYGNNTVAGNFDSLASVFSNKPNTLVYADTLYHLQLAASKVNVSGIITSPDLISKVKVRAGLIITDEPRELFLDIHDYFLKNSLYCKPFEPHRGSNLSIHPSASIDEQCYLGDNIFVGENVVIRGCAKVGSNVHIDANSIIGVDGILYSRKREAPRRIEHGGFVTIEKNVVIMSGVKVVRSVHDTQNTIVGSSSIIGHNSVVGHEAQVGQKVVISNSCVLARNSRVGDESFLGTGSIIRENVTVGDNAKVLAGSVVINDVERNSIVSGNFAMNHRQHLRSYLSGKKTDEVYE